MAMNVLMLAPGYPGEMPLFCRALARQGARVVGVSDVPYDGLPEMTRASMAGYVQVPDFRDEDAVVRLVAARVGAEPVHRVACLWEPGVVLAAKLREALGVPGQDVAQANAFRNKDLMKQVITGAGLRTARHAAATTAAQVRAAAEAIGFPVIVKPIAGAGSMDTFRADSMEALDAALARMGQYDEVNVEEFIEGQEYTYDAISIEGEVRYENVCLYRPNPLVARSTEWISPQTLALRDLSPPPVQAGIALGRAVLRAMGFRTGFTHMEFFWTPRGEAVFGEIAARPPGARTVDLMNFVGDVDLFEGWAEAELHGRFSVSTARRYNACNVFKRAQGRGRITRVEGLERLLARHGAHVALVDLLPVGELRRDWVLTLVSDGYVVVRHPDLATCMAIADEFGTDLRLYAE